MSASPPVPEKEHPFYIFAMDHRASLAKDVYSIAGEPTADQAAHLAEGKRLVFEGAASVRDRLPAGSVPGVLVDERYGAAVARAAKEQGFLLLMPIERSGRPFFELEYGSFGDSDWLEHVEAFDPDYVKILVRDNPGFDTGDRRRQQEHLASVTQELHGHGRRFIIELLVPATSAQQAAGADEYDRTIRPGLTQELIREFQHAGVEPDIWKLEGYETGDAAAAVAATSREGGRAAVRCIVLGRDSTQDRLDHWLETAAPVDGFAGFAIGRSIWQQPLLDHLAGRIDASTLRARIGASYLGYADDYHAAATA